ncbi:hypothetical protein PPOLYM_02545 [Paenibacillus polymyxa]|uniref:hypothetical protein n=1 Tax=Paenibacillus polymyxa TaxID=1406 RepID=UPI00094736FD|nr:hypothetical protein [Paenibacillus polymyxa]APQ59826.1 hypothetical protein VK72_14480 [Paenibacillus polymyxa]VUG06152.1 hypothetical protein PPOLYM_02545 [Paenibacillus polymyxa]
MANKILITETYHEEIRGRLGVGKDVISDADIDALSVLPIGESRIVKAVPDYDELTGDNQTYVYAAAVCMVAAILAPSMTARIKKSKKDFDFSFENQAVDWKKYAVQLVDEAYEFIESISTVQHGTDVPVFGVAGPTRARERRCH